MQKPEVPAGSVHPIDAFVHHRLAAEGLQSSSAVDQAALLRRVSLDLTGLPPSPELQQAFLKEGYEALVDCIKK